MANAYAVTMIGLTVVVVVNLAYRYLPDGGNNATDPSTVSLVLDLAILGLVALGGTIGGSLTYDWGVSVETAGDHPAHLAGELDYNQPKDAP